MRMCDIFLNFDISTRIIGSNTYDLCKTAIYLQTI